MYESTLLTGARCGVAWVMIVVTVVVSNLGKVNTARATNPPYKCTAIIFMCISIHLLLYSEMTFKHPFRFLG